MHAGQQREVLRHSLEAGAGVSWEARTTTRRFSRAGLHTTEPSGYGDAGPTSRCRQTGVFRLCWWTLCRSPVTPTDYGPATRCVVDTGMAPQPRGVRLCPLSHSKYSSELTASHAIMWLRCSASCLLPRALATQGPRDRGPTCPPAARSRRAPHPADLVYYDCPGSTDPL